ncbi:phosphohistidine phosphatase SixA [Amphritea balenae]|uniref:Phosphohistidine phosphatase SixA n=1 Tax=Amphritea balenae TaxID=452629 RepID=A0A3P1SKF5_9GAMM|nr:phosphohistidine phosphatase SixA [Amphritea balenae]RRC97771.1 phosphohistidine phosphatase SixA [Amphritea balenae]GGK82870.1 phosphohistidine phosphatase SixA [Amphritea balenae]
MKLVLLRHGEAGFDAISDEQRSLTANGRLRLEQMLEQHCGLLDDVERAVHSPYLRTCQTAELVNQYRETELQALSLLTPESSAAAVIEWLALQPDQALLLVTHQPLIGNLVSLLCEGDLSRPEPMLPGAMAVIELEFLAAGLGRLQMQVR